MKDAVDLEGVIFIDCPQEEMEKRLLERGLTSGRTDDNIETARYKYLLITHLLMDSTHPLSINRIPQPLHDLRKRFATYHAATMPVVNYFEQEQKLLRIGMSYPLSMLTTLLDTFLITTCIYMHTIRWSSISNNGI